MSNSSNVYPDIFKDSRFNIIYLNDLLTAPADTTDSLYQFGGDLYFEGINLSAGIGSSLWNLVGAGPDIYYDSGNVGIGLNNPAYPLEVTGNAKFNTALIMGNTISLFFQDSIGGLSADIKRHTDDSLIIENNTIDKNIYINTIGIGFTEITKLKVNTSISLLESTGATFYTTFSAGNQSADINYILPITQGGVNTYLKNDGFGNLSWETISSASTPGGLDTYVQFNDAGTFGGDSGLTYDKNTDILTIKGGISLEETGAGSNLITITANPVTGSRTYTIPDAGSNANFIVSPSTPAQGDILYYNGTTWVSLTAGTSGYYLKTQGAGANPIWAEVASGPTSGYDTLWLPAGAAISSNTAGALNSDREYPTYDVNIDVVEFSPIVDEYVEFNVVLPDNWDLGTLKAKFYWTYDVVPTSGTTVEFGIEASAKSNDDAIDAAWGTEVVVTDTAIAVNDLHITSATSAITVGGTISVGDLINIRVGRNSTSVNDDLSSPVLLIGVLLQFYRSGSISGW